VSAWRTAWEKRLRAAEEEGAPDIYMTEGAGAGVSRQLSETFSKAKMTTATTLVESARHERVPRASFKRKVHGVIKWEKLMADCLL